MPAVRNSINRPAGTPVTINLAVTKQKNADMIIINVLPAIQDKWPLNNEGKNKTIFMQHDNTSTHFGSNNGIFVESSALDGRNIKLIGQPENLPNMNITALNFSGTPEYPKGFSGGGQP